MTKIGTQFFQIVCLNGHQISFRSSSKVDPENYCEICGGKLIATCQKCHKTILGYNRPDNVMSLGPKQVTVPNYCRYCSDPYPWTKLLLENAVELIALDDVLSPSDKALIKSAIPDLIVETPKTPLAEAKFKKVFSKASVLVKDGLYNLLVDALSETMKKSLFS